MYFLVGHVRGTQRCLSLSEIDDELQYQYCKISAGEKFPKQRKMLRRFGQIIKLVKSEYKRNSNKDIQSDSDSSDDAEIEDAKALLNDM